MAKHAKHRHARKKPLNKKAIIGAAVAGAGVIVVTLAVLLVSSGLLQSFVGTIQALAQRKTGAASSTSTTAHTQGVETQPTGMGTRPTEQQPDPEPAEPVFLRPAELRGVWLTAGMDYLVSGKENGAAVKKQIEDAFDTITGWQFNSVLVPVTVGGKALYSSQLLDATLVKNTDGSVFDPIAYILETARKKGVFVYGVLDLQVGDGKKWDPATAADANKIISLAAEAAARYAFDGYLLDNYGFAYGDGGSFATYMQTAPGSDYESFLRASVKAAVTETIQTLRAADNNLYIGLLSNAVWAHQRNDSRGSATDNLYEDLTDGYADTLSWLQEGLFDFIMVKNYTSLSNSSAAFEKILQWWAKVCTDMKLPMYVAHAADKVTGKEAGWSSPDQLSRQILACQGCAAWNGSAFNSLAALKKYTDSTNALLKVFAGTILQEYIADSLTFVTPKSTTFTTKESKLSFQGGGDPNFPMTMNGKPVTLSQHGFFAIDQTLTPGLNTFTFVHKGKTVVYKITYVVNVIQSVSPNAAMSLDGGTEVVFSAIARKGSTVYAMFNGKKLTMKASPLQGDEEAGVDLSDYENYAASYTLPKGIAGKTQPLGAATVYASYSGLNENMKGGAITIKALPVVEAPDEEIPGVLTDLKPINPSQGGTILKTGRVVIVTSDYAETFTGTTSDDYSRPTNAYLPKGTTDVVVKAVYGPASYYLLGSGRRVYQSDVKEYVPNGRLSANSIDKADVQIIKSHTMISFETDWRIPYNVRLLPQSYQKDTTSSQPDYAVNSTGQTTEYVDITFSYTTQVCGVPDISDSPLFSKAEWIKGADNTHVLRLHLKNKSQFYGYSVVWDNDGVLHFSFKHPTSAAGNTASQKLKGIKIVIDPGHGGNSVGTAGGNVAEKTLTLKYGLMLRDKLQALGATVVMTRTTDINPDLTVPGESSMVHRVNYARNNKTDLFISIHMNGAASSASGCTLHYFNEYSYAPSRLVYDAMREVEKSYDIGNRSPSGAVGWDPFYVTRFSDAPSMLIECGFMTNTKNLELLINPTYQQKMVQAMTDGIVQYFSGLPQYNITVTTTTTTGSTTSAPTTDQQTGNETSATGSAGPTGTAESTAGSSADQSSSKAEGASAAVLPAGLLGAARLRKRC